VEEIDRTLNVLSDVARADADIGLRYKQLVPVEKFQR
jgi:hypothetical protein